MKVILSMAISANGMIATNDGKEDFLSHDNWLTFIELAKKCGNFIYGRKTYEEVNKWPDNFIEDIKSIPTHVVISENLNETKNGFEIAKSPKDAIDLLKSKGHSEILLTGGSLNNSSFAKEGLIDEIILNFEPAVVGRGIPVFAPGDFDLNLELIDTKKITNDIIQFHYKVLK